MESKDSFLANVAEDCMLFWQILWCIHFHFVLNMYSLSFVLLRYILKNKLWYNLSHSWPQDGAIDLGVLSETQTE